MPRILGLVALVGIAGLFAYGLASSYSQSMSSVRRKDARVLWTAARLVEARLNALDVALDTALETCRLDSAPELCLRSQIRGMTHVRVVPERVPALDRKCAAAAGDAARRGGLCGVSVPTSLGYGSPLVGRLPVPGATPKEATAEVGIQVAFEISDILRSAAESSQQLAGVALVDQGEILESVPRPGSPSTGSELDFADDDLQAGSSSGTGKGTAPSGAPPTSRLRVPWLDGGSSPLQLVGRLDQTLPLGRFPIAFKYFVLGGILLLAMILCLPFLRLVAIGPAERLSRWDVRQMGLAGWAAVSSIAYLLVFWGASSLSTAFEPTLRDVAGEVRKKISEQVRTTKKIAAEVEDCLETGRRDAEAVALASLAQPEPCETLTLPRQVPGTMSVSLMSSEGKFLHYWKNGWPDPQAARKRATPEGDFSDRDYFRRANKQDPRNPTAVIQFVESRVTGQTRFIVAHRLREAVLVVANDVPLGGYVLPPGVEFALVDRQGSVLIQSYQRNLRDLGLLSESSAGTALVDAVRAQSSDGGLIQGSRSGDMVDYLVLPLRPDDESPWIVAGDDYEPAWSLVLMTDRDDLEAFLAYATSRWSKLFFTYGLGVLVALLLSRLVGAEHPGWSKLCTSRGRAYLHSALALSGVGLVLLGTAWNARPAWAALASVGAAAASFLVLRLTAIEDRPPPMLALASIGAIVLGMEVFAAPRTVPQYAVSLLGVIVLLFVLWSVGIRRGRRAHPSPHAARWWFAISLTAALTVTGAVPATLTARAVLRQSLTWLVRHGHARMEQNLSATGDLAAGRVVSKDTYERIRKGIEKGRIDLHQLRWDLSAVENFYTVRRDENPDCDSCRPDASATWESWPSGGWLAQWLVAGLYGQTGMARALDGVSRNEFDFEATRCTEEGWPSLLCTAFGPIGARTKVYLWSERASGSHVDLLASGVKFTGLLVALACIASWIVATHFVMRRVFPEAAPPVAWRSAGRTERKARDPEPASDAVSVLDLDSARTPKPAWLGGRVVPAEGAVRILAADRAFGTQELQEDLLGTIGALRCRPRVGTTLVSSVDLREALESANRSRRLKTPAAPLDAEREMQAVCAWEQVYQDVEVVPPSTVEETANTHVGPTATPSARMRAWLALTPEERLVLAQVAEEGYASWRHAKALALLVGRGWLRLRPATELVTSDLRDFVLWARSPAEILEMERLGSSHVRSALEGGIVSIAAAMLLVLYFLRPDLFNLVLPAVSGLTVALSRVVPLLSKVRSLAQRAGTPDVVTT